MTNPYSKDDIRHNIWDNVQSRKRLQHEFRLVFGVPIAGFWDNNLVGFNLVKFDDQFVQSGDRSIREVVQERFGDRGVSIILQLIHPDGEIAGCKSCLGI